MCYTTVMAFISKKSLQTASIIQADRLIWNKKAKQYVNLWIYGYRRNYDYLKILKIKYVTYF